MDDVLQNDELEEREKIALTNKIKRRKRRKRIRITCFLLFLTIFIVYMISDYSNIQIIETTGNVYYSKQQIMEKSKISYEKKSMMVPSFLIEKRLKKDPMIKNVEVDKEIHGVVRIQVEEEKLLGYYEKQGNYYLLIRGEEDVLIKDKAKLANVPYLVDLNKSLIEEYKKQMDLVDKSSIYLVSEVARYETSYDANMLELTMQDGHVVHTSIADLKLLNQYTEILKGLKSELKCIVFVGETGSMYTEKCE